MDWKDPNKEKFQANRTRGRVKLEGVRGTAFNDADQLEGRWESSHSAFPKWTLVLMTGGLIAVVVAAVITYRSSENPSVTRSVGELESVVADTVPFMERASAEEIRQAVENTVSGFMNASSNVERCRYVLGGEQLENKMDEFYSRYGSASQPNGFGRIQSAEEGAFAGETMMMALGVEQSGKRAFVYSLYSEGEGLKIDWEASVSYGEYSWPRFLREKPQESVQMRVYLQRLPVDQATRYENDDYHAYELTAFGENQVEALYVKKDREEARSLEVLVPGRLKHPMNLALSWNDRGEIELRKIIHNLWSDPERVN